MLGDYHDLTKDTCDAIHRRYFNIKRSKETVKTIADDLKVNRRTVPLIAAVVDLYKKGGK